MGKPVRVRDNISTAMHDKPPAEPTRHPPHVSEMSPPKVGKPSGFRSLVGYHALEWRQDYAEIELELGPQHTNSLGIVHGGVLMTILDAAMGHATTWTSVKGNVRACVTLSLTTSFLESPRTGRIKAIARLVSNENRVAVAEGEIRSAEGHLMCIAQGSFRYFPGSEKPEGVPKSQLRR